MKEQYSYGWSDPRPAGKVVYMYQKEYQTMWTTVLPEKFRRYKVTCNGNLIGDQLTNEEAEAMVKLLNATIY